MVQRLPEPLKPQLEAAQGSVSRARWTGIASPVGQLVGSLSESPASARAHLSCPAGVAASHSGSCLVTCHSVWPVSWAPCISSPSGCSWPSGRLVKSNLVHLESRSVSMWSSQTLGRRPLASCLLTKRQGRQVAAAYRSNNNTLLLNWSAAAAACMFSLRSSADHPLTAAFHGPPSAPSLSPSPRRCLEVTAIEFELQDGIPLLRLFPSCCLHWCNSLLLLITGAAAACPPLESLVSLCTARLWSRSVLERRLRSVWSLATLGLPTTYIAGTGLDPSAVLAREKTAATCVGPAWMASSFCTQAT